MPRDGKPAHALRRFAHLRRLNFQKQTQCRHSYWEKAGLSKQILKFANTPTPSDARNIKAKVLVLHGADDPFVPPKEVEAFQEEMRQGGVDWQLVAYGGAVHSFTDWNAGNDNSKGAAYHERADKRSWEAMKQFFGELFK